MSLLVDIYKLIYDNCKSELDARNATNKIEQFIYNNNNIQKCSKCDHGKVIIECQLNSEPNSNYCNKHFRGR